MKRPAMNRTVTRLALLGLLAFLTACAGTADIARRPGVQTADAPRPEVFRTVLVEAGTHSDAVTSLAVDQRETLLLTGSTDKTARLWNVADGAPRGVLRPPIGDADLGRIDAVGLSPDGRLAAVGGRSAGPTQDAVLVFDTRDQRLISRLEHKGAGRHTATVGRIAFSGDGQRLAVRYAPSGAVAWFDVRSGEELGRPPGPEAVLVQGAAPRELNLTQQRRITANDSGRIALSDASGRPAWEVAPASLGIDCVDALGDGSRVGIVVAGGARLFSAAKMEWSRGADTTPRCVSLAAPRRLADGGLLQSDGARIRRQAPDGRLVWQDAPNRRVKAMSVSADGGAVVVALGDGTLRWLDAATGAERLAVYLHPKGGWVAWTPEGFFDHSDEAWNFAGWQVNRGPRRAAEFVRLGQLYDVAYRPDLIRLAYAGRAASAEAIRLQDAVDPRGRLTAGLPPLVAITVSPSADRRTAVVDAEVAERGGGVGKLLYRINGVVVAIDQPEGEAPPASALTLHLRRTLPLRNGPNQIDVVALNGANELESAAAVKTVAEGRADPRQGQLWAVIVGVNGYADPSMRLRYARPDGEAIAAALARNGASTFSGTHVVQLFDADATVANLTRTVTTMSETMAESDTFVLYLSGHGVNVRGRFHFVTYDVTAPTLTQVLTRGLSQDALQDLLARIPAGRAVVVLDTCFSGSSIALSDDNMLIRSADRRLARATGRSVLAAATDQQHALEGYRGHGVLTAVLLDGLNGAAAPQTEAITDRALGSYAIGLVPVISAERFGANQLPVFSSVGQDIVFVRPRKQR
jgi:Caspase domain